MRGRRTLLVLLLKRSADSVRACVRVAGADRDTLCCAIGLTVVVNTVLHITANALDVVTAILLFI